MTGTILPETPSRLSMGTSGHLSTEYPEPKPGGLIEQALEHLHSSREEYDLIRSVMPE